MPTPKNGPTLCQLTAGNERIFSLHPQVSRYFPSASMEDARKRLGRAIERGDGPGLVVGGPGTGKSLLLQVLAAQYHQRFDVVLLACARLCTRRALLQAVLFELGLPYKTREEGELRLGLLDHLLSAEECPAGLLLLVDEAQSLPVALLDELRVLTNLVRGDRPRVGLVLAGTSALEESFASAELESFSQRLAARCYLAPLSRVETSQYIRAQLAARGGAPDQLIAADALEAVFEATDGVPRLVNQLCDRALEFCAADGRAQVDQDVIQRAWSDLQQLPTPWDSPAAATTPAAASPSIEFGNLQAEPARFDRSIVDDAEPLEPTELDFDEGELNVVEAAAAVEAIATVEVVDPFAEQFEEEELVLDNFAAWEDLFGPRWAMPKVENRRDPGFASLVQAAMDAAPLVDSKGDKASPLAVVRELDEFEADDERLVGRSAATQSAQDRLRESPDRPSLRLAVVSDPAPLKPIPLLPSSTQVDDMIAAAFDAIVRAEPGHLASKKAVAESPVLLVEDDGAPSRGNAPVRREEYRHLFSRLRSG